MKHEEQSVSSQFVWQYARGLSASLQMEQLRTVFFVRTKDDDKDAMKYDEDNNHHPDQMYDVKAEPSSVMDLRNVSPDRSNDKDPFRKSSLGYRNSPTICTVKRT